LTRTNYITVTVPPPAADFTATPLTGAVPLTVTFSNNSTNADSYLWQFGDGITSTIAAPSHTYEQNGVYTVTLTATGPGGEDTQMRSGYITVSDAPITGLQAFNDGPTALGHNTTLSAAITGGSNVVYAWDLGDGTSGSGATINHAYASAGTYTAMVTATNTAGQEVATTTATVYDLVADFTASPVSGVVPLTVTFANQSTDATSYLWDFGDGATSTLEHPAHTYTQTGNYTVTLTAYGFGEEATRVRSEYITVNDAPITGLQAHNDGPTPLGNSTALSATIGEGSNVVYSWDFGDGVTGNRATVTHAYGSIGTYTATVTATNSVSQRTTSTVVTVAPGPAVSLGATLSPTNAFAGEEILQLVVEARDAAGNLATGYRGRVEFAPSAASTGIPDVANLPDYVFTAADAGRAVFDGIAFNVAGQQYVYLYDYDEETMDATSNAVTITDLLPPAAPQIAAPLCGVTNQAQPHFAGTAQAGSTVQLSGDGLALGTAVADGQDEWEQTAITPLTDGRHLITATATTAQGTSSASSLDLTVNSGLCYDPVSITFAQGNSVQHLQDSAGCAAPGNSLSVVLWPGAPVTVSVPLQSEPAEPISVTVNDVDYPLLDPDGDGRYTATFMPPTGEEPVRLQLGCETVQVAAVIDPDGYIHDAGRGGDARLAGATVTLYAWNVAAGRWDAWPAHLYGQANPQTTGADGYYSFFVPPGDYRLRVEKAGYDSYVSATMHVGERGLYSAIAAVNRAIREPIRFNVPLQRLNEQNLFLPLVFNPN
jgi:PKD repeat protein